MAKKNNYRRRKNTNKNKNKNVFNNGGLFGGLSEVLNVNPCTGKIHEEKVKISRSRLALGVPHWKLSAATLSLWYNMYRGKLTKDKNGTQTYFDAVTSLLGGDDPADPAPSLSSIKRGNALRRMATMRIFLDPRYIPGDIGKKTELTEYRIIDLNNLKEGTADYDEKCAALDWIMCWYATNQFTEHNDSIPSCKYGGKKTLTQWPNPKVHSNYFHIFKGDPRRRENAIDRQMMLGGSLFGGAGGDSGGGGILDEYRKRLEPFIPPLLNALFKSDFKFMENMRMNDCKLGATDISALVGAMGAKGKGNVLGNPKILNRFLGGCNGMVEGNAAGAGATIGGFGMHNILDPNAAFNRKYIQSLSEEQASEASPRFSDYMTSLKFGANKP